MKYTKFGEASNVVEVTSDLTEHVIIKNLTYESSPLNFMLIGGLTPNVAVVKKIEISNIKASGLTFDRFGYVFSTADYFTNELKTTITLSDSTFSDINFVKYGQVFLLRH
jgi:hypothetical protein